MSMTAEEELELISELLDESFVPKTSGLAIYSTFGRVTLLAEKMNIDAQELARLQRVLVKALGHLISLRQTYNVENPSLNEVINTCASRGE